MAKTGIFLKTQAAIAAILCAILFTAAVPSRAAEKDEKPTRTVKGIVTDDNENPIVGAVVQLKNTKTLQVKSFITDKGGNYYFHGLDTNTDFELKARSGDLTSRTRTVSTFDERKEVVYNFQLKSK
jgi:hypothetical protein